MSHDPRIPTMSMIQELRIEGLAWGGDGIAHLDDGRIIFVQGALPQQRVRVRITDVKKRMARGVCIDVLDQEFAPVPACPTADRCGGCTFQGVPYELELSWKVKALQDSLSRVGRTIEWPTLTVVPAPSTKHYRTRVRLRVGEDGQTGYRAKASHDFVPAIRCDVLHPALEAIRPYVGYLAANLPSVHRVRMEWDDVRGQVVIEIPAEPDTWERIKISVLERVAKEAPPTGMWRDAPVAVSVALRHQGRWEAVVGDGVIFRAYDPARVKQPSGQFAQANHELNRRLRERVAAWACGEWDASRGVQRVADLFSGAGNLSFALAARGARVVGFDHASTSIDNAEAANADLHDRRVAEWKRVNLAEGPFQALSPLLAETDTVVLDPPRGGVSEQLLHVIHNTRAGTMVYVSCDPPAFARDATRLAAMGWRVQRMEAWDMFPRTAHVELLTYLVRDTPISARFARR